MLLFSMLLSLAVADDALDKKVFLLRRAVKNNDCQQASEMVEKLVVEYPDYADFWKSKAEVDTCMGASDFDRYLAYEKYMDLGGDRSKVDSEMSVLEAELYSVRVKIDSDNGISDWSDLEISLNSDRWVKESNGVYLLKYSPQNKYPMRIKSSNPLIEGEERTFSGIGFHERVIVLKDFKTILDKKVYFLNQTIESGDCRQASKMVEKLVVEYPDHIDFWKSKAEIETCLNASSFDRYLNYEKYIAMGGERSNVDKEMSALEAQLYSVRVKIDSDSGISDWSDLEISLNSDRWVKESNGVYLLKYSPQNKYTLTIKSSNPLLQGYTQSLSGVGFQEKKIALQSFDSILNKEIFLLRRSIENSDCQPALEMVEKLIVKYPDHIDFWKSKAEIETCLNASSFDRYLNYEKYIAMGGERSNVDKEMSALEAQLYSVRVKIDSDSGISDWSDLEISLNSDRWVKESNGVYLLKYSPQNKYTLTIKSSNPLVESNRLTLTGVGLEERVIELNTFEAAHVNIPVLDPELKLQVYPANSTNIPINGTLGTHDIGAGPATISASFHGETIQYTVDFYPGSNDIILPWMYTVKHANQELHHEILPPDTQELVQHTIMVSSPFQELSKLHIKFSLKQQLGKNQVVNVTQEQFEKSVLKQHVLQIEELNEESFVLRKRLRLLSIGSIAGIALSGGTQTLALSSAAKANGIREVTEFDEFKAFRRRAYSFQAGSIGLLGGGLSGMGMMFSTQKKIAQINTQIGYLEEEIEHNSLIIE